MYPAHRIDKMTSGVLIMAKKPKHNFGVEEK
jgi:23S rRNA-/tRNA-specific pseudouridylate synthase